MWTRRLLQNILRPAATAFVAAGRRSSTTTAAAVSLALGGGSLVFVGTHSDTVQSQWETIANRFRAAESRVSTMETDQMIASVNEAAAPMGDSSKSGVLEDIRARVIKKYEDRIHIFSSPARIFNYYATVQSENGEWLMTPEGFLLSLFPFAEIENLSDTERNAVGFEHLKIPRASVRHVNPFVSTGHGGLITYAEFIFLRLMLETPLSQFEIAFKMFDADGNGTVDREEFDRAIKAQTVDLSSDGNVSSIDRRHGESNGLFDHFFGPDGSDKLSFSDFSDYLKSLRHKVLNFEFSQYDRKKSGTISVHDLAVVLLNRTSLRGQPAYEKRALALRSRSERITFESFLGLHEFISNIDSIENAIRVVTAVNGRLNREDVRRAASVAANIQLTDLQLDIIFTLFDENGDGNLDHREFVDALSMSARFGVPPRTIRGHRCLKGFLQCVMEKTS